MNDLISVIVPVYKVENYLHSCVDSILNQTYSNLEIILVDDGSPDGCGQICDAYNQMDSRVKVIHQENAGVGVARNSGMKMASGEYIMFVDSDDWLAPDAIQTLYDRLIADSSAFAMGKHTDAYEDGRLNESSCAWMQDSVLSGAELLGRMDGRYNVPVAAWAKLYRREVLEQILYPRLKCAEDLWVFPDIVDGCERISVVGKTIYYYFQRSDSLIHAKSEVAKTDELDATLKMTRVLWEGGHSQSARYWFCRGISKALDFADKTVAAQMFGTYFARGETSKLLAGASIKDRLKWAVLHSNAAGKLYDWMKRLKRG